MSQKTMKLDRIEQLEMLLFAVVRAMLLPVSLRLEKTDEELTKKTFEAIRETERSLDYDRIKALMVLGRNNAANNPSDKKYDCAKCVNKKSPLCNLCSYIQSPSQKESKPKYFIPMKEIIPPALVYIESNDISPVMLIKEYLNQALPLPFELVRKYNELSISEEKE